MALLDADERASIEAAQHGSASDLETVFRAQWPRAYRASYLVVLDHQAAEDIVQEAFLGAVRLLDSFGGDRPFGPWLHRLVVNRSIDRARSRLLRPGGMHDAVGEVTEPIGWDVPLGGPHLDPAASALAGGLASLSPDHRAVVTLRGLLEYSAGEAAELLDLPKATVEARLREASDRLRAMLPPGTVDDERALRTLLLQLPVPGEHLAVERTWDVVRSAYVHRVPASSRRRLRLPLWLLGALALAAGVAALIVTPAGSTMVDWVRDRLGRERVVTVEQASPVPLGLPAPGVVLVAGGGIVQVVDEQGTRRRLGAYRGASFAATGRLVAAWDDAALVGLDPAEPDLPLWRIEGEGIAGARWSEDGFRIAYLRGRTLHVAGGNGADDRRLARGVAPAPPAWQPGTGDEHVVAYARRNGLVRVVDADTGRQLWRTQAGEVVALAWSADGTRLAVLATSELRILTGPNQLAAAVRLPDEVVGVDLAARPGTQDVAYSVYAAATGKTSVFLFDAGGQESRLLFAGPGRVPGLVWSPDGQLLLVPWRSADQWLFVPAGAAAETTASIPAVSAELGTSEAFPRPDGWCCASVEGG